MRILRIGKRKNHVYESLEEAVEQESAEIDRKRKRQYVEAGILDAIEYGTPFLGAYWDEVAEWKGPAGK
jgi:hypothetical protein